VVEKVFATRARLGDRLLGFLGVRLVVFLIAAKGFLPGVLNDPAYNVAYYHDEHNVVMHEEAARIAIGDHHQFPAWNPYFCGGIVQAANAPSNAVAPDFLLRVIWGTLPGRRLAVLLFVVLGMEGLFRFARHQGASAIGAAMGAVAFSCSGHFVSLLGWGWIFMFHYNLVPWCALAYEKGLRSNWWIIAGGFFMAWLVLGGGTYVAPYTGLVLFLLMLFASARAVFKLDGAQSVKYYRPAAVLSGMAVVAVALSAVRLFPLLGVLASHARPVDQKDQTGPISIISMLALPHEHAAWGGGAGEYYMGMWVFVLAVVALLLADRRASKAWVIALFFGVLGCGEFIEDAPYVFMRKLPVLSQLRFPVRMVTVAALFVAVAGAVGLTRIEDLLPQIGDRIWARFAKLREKFGERPPVELRVAVAILALVPSAWIAYRAAWDVVEHDSIRPGAVYNMGAPLRYADEFRQARGNRWDAHVWPFANRGSLHCFEEHQLFESPYVRGDLAHDEYAAPGTDTAVERVRWSPNEIVVRVKSPNGPGRFLVNQNHNDAWKTDVGELGSDGGLISVKVPQGEHVVTLTYSDWRIRLGALVTFATSLAIAIAAVKAIRRRWKRSAPVLSRLS
jgi:hypothetical protein